MSFFEFYLNPFIYAKLWWILKERKKIPNLILETQMFDYIRQIIKQIQIFVKLWAKMESCNNSLPDTLTEVALTLELDSFHRLLNAMSCP